MYDICRTFRAGQGPWLATGYQAEYGIPIRLILDVVHLLQAGGLIVETAGSGQVPARDTGLITLGDVEQALQGEPDQRTTLLSRRLGQELIELLGAKEESHKKALAQTTFAELVLKKERAANG
jgi:DNA-binding IscR family transcriptional regulator